MFYAFWFSMFMVFIAELGDKTQLVALCMAVRYNARTVLAGVFCATFVIHLFSVAIGGTMGRLLPGVWITFIAGLAFVVFGMWTLKGDALNEDDCKERHRSPFWAVAITFFLAELGDKTMLSTVALASKYSWVPVWLGSSIGMVLSDGLAIWVGQVMGKKLPERAVKIGAAIIFFGFGAYSVSQTVGHLPTLALIGGMTALAILAIILFAIPSKKEDKPAPACSE